MATLYDVCKKTGLSSATVSRVINDSGLVKAETRELVLRTIKELNYRPHHAARMLAGRNTDTIGVMLPEIDNGFYVQVLRGIDRVSRKENLNLLISFYHSDSELTECLGSLFGEGRTDAVILMTNNLSPETVRELTGADFPVVLIGQNHGSMKSIDSVLIDNFEGAYNAVQHLLEPKPKSLLLLTGPQDNHDSKERLRGALNAVQDASCKVHVDVIESDFTHDGGRRAFAKYAREQGVTCNAVFAFNDAMSLGVLDVLAGSDKRVPEDIRIVGFDNNEISHYIGLSTVDVPIQQIGAEAGQLVANRIKHNEAKPTNVSLKTSLVVRKTS